MKSIECLYNEEIFPRAIKDNSCDFINFTVETITRCLGKEFQFDYLSLNLFTLKENGMLDGGLTSIVHNLDERSIPSYEKNIIYDPFTPLALSNVGHCFISDNIKPYEEWLETPIYEKHCLPFDIHYVLAIAFRIPNWERRNLVFHFINGYKKPFKLTSTNLRKIEFACIPFWQCWLYKHGQMCRETLQYRLSLLRNITPQELYAIKLLLKYPQYSMDEIVKLPSCPVGYSALRDQIQRICNKLPQQFSSHDGGYRVTQVYSAFSFLMGCCI